MSVAAISAVARVTRNDVYALFGGAAAIRHQVFERAASALVDPMCDAYHGQPTFATGVLEALRTLVNYAADDPRNARLCFVVSQEEGPDTPTLCQRAVATVSATLHAEATNASDQGITAPLPIGCEAIVGGVWHTLSRHLLDGQVDLTPLLPDLAGSVLSAFGDPDSVRGVTLPDVGSW